MIAISFIIHLNLAFTKLLRNKSRILIWTASGYYMAHSIFQRDENLHWIHYIISYYILGKISHHTTRRRLQWLQCAVNVICFSNSRITKHFYVICIVSYYELYQRWHHIVWLNIFNNLSNKFKWTNLPVGRTEHRCF